MMFFFLIPTGYQARSTGEDSTVINMVEPGIQTLRDRIWENRDEDLSISHIISATTDSRIHVDGNWSETAAVYDWCTGSGTYNDPYTIRDLVIDANGSGYGILIENSWEYFRIENCIVFNSHDAEIALFYVGNGTVSHNTVYNTLEHWHWNKGYGIAIYFSSNVTISDNICTDNKYSGIHLYFSHYNVVANNTCRENRYHGISSYNCDRNNITRNDCIDNGYYGIRFYYVSNNIVTGNNCTGNYRAGIYLDYSHNNAIAENNCTDSDSNHYGGIYTYYSDYNTVTGNNCTGNYHGIRFYKSDHNGIDKNICNNNSDYGIHLDKFSSYNIVAGNNCTGNYYGIYVYYSDYNTVTGNNCTENYEGIRLYISDNAVIIRNTCTKNSHYGITLVGSEDSIVVENKCTGNEYGIGLVSDYSHVVNNTCRENRRLGIYLYDSIYNNVVGNNCTKNGYSGIYLWYSDYNTVTENRCEKNSHYGIYLYSGSDYNDIYNNSLIKNTEGCLKDIGENNNIYNNICILILVAVFETNTTVIATGQSVEFTDTTIGGSMPLAYQWSFGDGSVNSTDQNPVHRYDVLGKYTVVLTVTDADGDMSVSASTIFVEDTIVPVLDSPNDITYEQGADSHNISWTSVDVHPGTYIIYENNVEIESGSWFSDVAITVNVDGLTPGTYDYTIVVFDTSNNSATDTVIVTVEDTTAPVLTTPAGVIYEQGETGNNITWTATDYNPDTYIVYRDGIEIASGTWTSSNPIIVNVDGLLSGSYDYTIVVADMYGSSVSNTVIVTVTETTTTGTTTGTTTTGDITTTSTTDGNAILIVSLIAAVILVAVVVFLIWKRKSH